MRGSRSGCSSALRSQPPPPPPRAPAQIQDTHKATGRPRRALRSRRPPRAAGSARGGSGSLKVKAEARGAPWSSPGAGGAWRAPGAGPRVCKRPGTGAPRAGSPAASLSLARLSRVRPVRSLLLRFFSLFFFSPLSGVNAGKQEPQPRRAAAAAAAAATHWGLARARKGPEHTRPRAPGSRHRRSRGAPRPARAKTRSPGSQGRAERSRGVGCEAARRRLRPPQTPPARALAPARARSHAVAPTRTAPATLHAPFPPAGLQKQCPRRRAGLGTGAGWGGEARRERGGRAVRCPRGSLKTTARLGSAFPRFLKSFIVSCSCCKINKCVHAAFFSPCAGKPERSGRGTPGRKETPRLPRRALSHRLGWPQRRDGRAWGSGVLRGEGSARGARIGAERGDSPPPAAGPEPGKGGPDRLPRVPRARPRGGRQGAQQALGREGWPAECRLPPSLRERKCGGPDWGPARLGRAGRASKTRGPPRMLLAQLRAPPRGRLLGAATERARVRASGAPEARGRVRGAPE